MLALAHAHSTCTRTHRRAILYFFVLATSPPRRATVTPRPSTSPPRHTDVVGRVGRVWRQFFFLSFSPCFFFFSFFFHRFVLRTRTHAQPAPVLAPRLTVVIIIYLRRAHAHSYVIYWRVRVRTHVVPRKRACVRAWCKRRHGRPSRLVPLCVPTYVYAFTRIIIININQIRYACAPVEPTKIRRRKIPNNNAINNA